MSGTNKKKKNKADHNPRGTETKADAEAQVEQAEQVSTEADIEGGDGAYEGSDEVPSAEVADARAKVHAENSDASVQPTVHNDNMADDPTEPLTEGQRDNLEDDDPRKDDPEDQPATVSMPNATPAERASSLPVNEEETDKYDAAKAAKKLGVDAGTILAIAVRGNAMTGLYLRATTTDGQKHTVAL